MATLTPEQLKRLAYGVSHSIIQQCLDNGELGAAIEADNDYLPSDFELPEWGPDFEAFVEEVQAAIEGTVMSDLFEEAAKLDG